jgi:putative ABC transport system permease protein
MSTKAEAEAKAKAKAEGEAAEAAGVDAAGPGWRARSSGPSGIPRLHRVLLRLHPRAFREDFGPAVEEMLAERAAEARRRGRVGRARFWVREAAGLATSLASERVGAGGFPAGANRGRRTRPWGGVMDTWKRELRHAVRRLLRSPSFSLAGMVTLGLAIGANAAIFTVVDRVVISPLPYPESDRIVYLDHGARGLDYESGLGTTSGLHWQYAHRARTVRDVSLYQSGQRWTATWPDGPVTVQVARTTPSFVQTLGVMPTIGRWFTEEEGRPASGRERVVVLSHGLWQRRFGGSAAVLGEVVPMYGVPYEIVGVMPRGFAFPSPDVEAWVPFTLDETSVQVGGFNYGGIARMENGVALEQVRAELDALIARVSRDFPGDETALPMIEQAGTFSVAVPLKEWVVGSTAGTLWILLGAVGVVLLVACANVANLFLVRAESRQREVAVREALGAGRRAIAGFYFAETLVLAAAGGALGFVLALGGVRLLVAFGPANLPRLHEVRIDAPAILFTLLVSVAAALALAAAPLLRRRGGPARTLHESGRGNTATGGRLRVRSVLMGAQIALALVLLVASGLLMKSFQRMRAVDPGYDPASTLLVRIGLFSETYPMPEDAARFHAQVLERVRAMPGVIDAAVTTCPPLSSYCHGDPVSLPGKPWDAGDMPPIASFRRVGEDYFRTMGIRLVRGRLLDERDQQVRTRAIVIDERMAELYFPGEDPIGKQVLVYEEGSDPYEVVGIVNHVLTWGVRAIDEPAQIYFPLVSHTVAPANIRFAAYVVRTGERPLELVPALRAAIADLDRTVPLAEVTTLDRMLADDRAPTAFTMTLIGLASVVALVLGLVGIYGVISYVVAQRSAEIGVRLALGALPGDVVRLIVRQGGAVAGVGLAVGLVAAVSGSSLIDSLLFGVSPTDVPTYALVTGTLLVVSLLACWLPARRAAHQDPLAALRPD